MVKRQYSLDTPRRFMKPGFLRSHLGSFLQDLENRGYSWHTVSSYAGSVCHFAQWINQTQHRDGTEVTLELVTRFSKHRCRCPGGRRQRRPHV